MMNKQTVIKFLKIIFNKEIISFFANIAVIIAVIFGMYSWYQDNKLTRDTLEKQEQEKNMPPTMIVRHAIIGEYGNFSILPTFYIKKNSNKHFAMTYYSLKISRDINNNPLTSVMKSRGIPLYNLGLESQEILPNFTYEIDDGIFQTGKFNFYLNLDYNPLVYNYTIYNSSNKDILIEYDIEIEDLDSQISYVGSVMTKINGSNIQPQSPSRIYKPLKFNWVNIGINNEDDYMRPIEWQNDNMTPVEMQKLFMNKTIYKIE